MIGQQCLRLFCYCTFLKVNYAQASVKLKQYILKNKKRVQSVERINFAARQRMNTPVTRNIQVVVQKVSDILGYLL